MALGDDPISLSQIQTKFGGSNPIAISEYYGAAAGVPASGEIAFSDFYDALYGPEITRTQFSTHSYSSSSSRNFTCALGATDAGRYTVIALTGLNSGTLSATLGGVSMTTLARAQYSNRAFSIVLFCDSSSLTTSETLSVTCSGGTIGRNGVSVFRCINISGTNVYTYANGSGSSLTDTFTAGNNTFVVAASASDEYPWSYISGLTNQYGASIDGQAGTAASWELITTGRSVTVTNPQNANGSGGPAGYERTLSIATFT